MTSELSVWTQVDGIYVVGTSDVHIATRELGISAETHRWGSTNYGHVVRHQGYWRYHLGHPELPKDAKPCVSFHGQIKETRNETYQVP